MVDTSTPGLQRVFKRLQSYYATACFLHQVKGNLAQNLMYQEKVVLSSFLCVLTFTGRAVIVELEVLFWWIYMLLSDIYNNPNFYCLPLADTEPLIDHSNVTDGRGEWLVSVGTTSRLTNSTYAFMARSANPNLSPLILRVNLHDLHVLVHRVAQAQDPPSQKEQIDCKALMHAKARNKQCVRVGFRLAMACPLLEALFLRRYRGLTGVGLQAVDFHRNYSGSIRASVGFLQTDILAWSCGVIQSLKMMNRALHEYLLISNDELQFLVATQGVLYSHHTRDAMIRTLEESSQLEVRVSDCVN